MSTTVRNGCLCLLAFLALLFLLPTPAAAQCDDNTRANFLIDVQNGESDSVLESKYGNCRAASAPAFPEGDDGSAVKSVVSSNIFWEKMNGCGYHPQAEMIACDVEIRRLTGYGPFGCDPGAGSFEHVRFCLDCDKNGTWDFQTLGFVHVTDYLAMPNMSAMPSWYHLAFASSFEAPRGCTINDGGQMNARFILSWAALPPLCANVPITQQPRPIWGQIIDETLRRDP